MTQPSFLSHKVTEHTVVAYYAVGEAQAARQEGTVRVAHDNGQDPRGNSAPFVKMVTGTYDYGDPFDDPLEAVAFLRHLNEHGGGNGYGWRDFIKGSAQVIQRTTRIVETVDEEVFSILTFGDTEK